DELALCRFAQVVAADRLHRGFDLRDDECEFAAPYVGSGGREGITLAGRGAGGDAAARAVGVVCAGSDDAGASTAQQDEEAEDTEDDPEPGAALARGLRMREGIVRVGHLTGLLGSGWFGHAGSA